MDCEFVVVCCLKIAPLETPVAPMMDGWLMFGIELAAAVAFMFAALGLPVIGTDSVVAFSFYW